jgi:GAF domain-containing protein
MIRLQDADRRLRIKSQSGLPGHTDLSTGEAPSRESYFGECFLDNRLIVVEDATRTQKPLVLPAADVPAPRSFVHAPIAIEEQPIGVLSAYSSTGRVYFSPEFLQFFRTLAVQLGLGLHNAQLYRELADLSSLPSPTSSGRRSPPSARCPRASSAPRISLGAARNGSSASSWKRASGSRA